MGQFANAKISVRQFTILIIIGVIGDSILIMPTIVAAYSKQDAWLSMALATLMGLVLGAVFAAIANRLQRQSPITALQNRIGKAAGGFMGLLFLFNFFMGGLTLMSEMSQFMTTQMMPETPVNAILLLFMAVIIIAYRYGIEAFARLSELLFPLFLFLFLFMVVFLTPQVDISNMKPMLARGLTPVIQGAIPAFVTGFTEMVVLLMLVPHVTGKVKLTKPILWGYAIGGLILFIVVDLCVLVLGPSLMETKYYPTFVLAQKITIGQFLERLEVILMLIWIITVFFKTLLLFFALTAGTAQVFGLKESRMLTIPYGMILIVATIAGTPNISEYNQLLLYYYPWFDGVFCIALPLVVLAVLMLTGKGKSSGQTGTKQ
ncbi:GerAB/ArcD/ProY family transporter [Paenibacillus gorillae]|uniref:GerAB/ArcD/ProY family transporter n=1 Tax=Paenibacillus gorillae TaxID=1243662 RepID=UPI0004B7ED61|nr:endospore germination permease [Paenibacillus gorillae]